ncbi:MAG TPA: hypothetical protein PKJ74_10380 [Chitinophagales bacterium]|jgi:hypothetical protein|nr:hypothetical protein [Sphingobacteriales bacterium]HNJ02455.1 hypothetical protein [Chitinophagales bacterium]MBK6888463.1 hypothetical protein [Sphingobacteriales bacterium]MBK7529016.1 hypothetical protein [Sphingobacteriales bacterium]MBK8678999.1 hypothetical protein [Sphingobacteriales bacterium]
MNEKDFVEKIKEQIAQSPEKFPFIAPKWEINISSTMELKVANYSRHQTKSHITRPFYKPISKIVDIEKMDENEK